MNSSLISLQNLCSDLSTLSQSASDLSGPVAITSTGPIYAADIQQRVQLWSHCLEQCSATTVAVYEPDCVEFLALLLALWQHGKTVLLCGDNLPASVAQLPDNVGALAGDFEAQTRLLHLRPNAASDGLSSGCLDSDNQALQPHDTALIVQTSGTTGAPKSIPYTLAQLDAELAMLEQVWRPECDSTLVVGSVSHQHLYGLIWRLLWPLVSQRPFIAERCHYPEQLQALAQQYDNLMLITTPTHLTRLPENDDSKDRDDLKTSDHTNLPMNSPWRLVICSTAPLSAEASLIAEAKLGCVITEVYGSSETGALAWRRQGENSAWQPLPNFEVDLDPNSQALKVRSLTTVSDQASQWITTGDRAQLLDNHQFILLGRLDRIAKIEGKRVSLAAIEQRLQPHPWIESCAALALQAQRSQVAVAACLTAAGDKQLAHLGKPAFCRQLRAYLSDSFETPVLPRRWRFVQQLPYNPQGKLPLKALLTLFDEPALNPASQTKLPLLLKTSLNPNINASVTEVSLSLHVQPELAWFQGHFDQHPVLPGVVQVHWAAYFAEQNFEDLGCSSKSGASRSFSHLEAIKFQSVIQPLQQLTLVLKWNSDTQKLAFHYMSEDTVFSSGRIVFTT